MNALVKKEIRLLLPAWIVAVFLAMVQAITRPYDFYVASLLFFGLTIMALSSIGRETSLNTFSSLLAQPAERIRIWQVKLSVLAVAFLVVFVVWLAAFGIAFHNSEVDDSAREGSYNLFITICLIATATFTGGLWTTLLLRQVAGAFWLTLLVPATLSGFSAVFFARSDSENLVIAVLSVVIGIYSIAGFFFARRLYFRAQDVGWSGGVIDLPEWKFLSARAKTGEEVRMHRPIFALLKKELLLQQGTLTGSAGLLILHIGIILLRTFHHFQKNSPGEALTSIFWMLWLVLPVIVGGIAVAEERKLGMMESQLCLPVSRRVQFGIKAFVTLALGIFLGGVVPVLAESIGLAIGRPSPALLSGTQFIQIPYFLTGAMLFSAWLTLVSFFGSSLAKSFLQSIGYAVLTFIVWGMVIPAFTARHMLFYDSIARSSILQVVIAVPTFTMTLLWLAWLNYRNFGGGWVLLRRSILGAIGAIVFMLVASAGVHNRAWEFFEPAEPAHGPAKLSLANPPVLFSEPYEFGDNLLRIQLPDGRIWFDHLDSPQPGSESFPFLQQIQHDLNPSRHSTGPHAFAGSTNWVSVVVGAGQFESVGIQSDGTLWISERSGSKAPASDTMTRFGNETNWQQVGTGFYPGSMLLLKQDGTLWWWGTNRFSYSDYNNQNWPGLRSFQPSQVGTNSDWRELYPGNGLRAQKADGTVWRVQVNGKGGKDVYRDGVFEQIAVPDRFKSHIWDASAYVRTNGTLWWRGRWRERAYDSQIGKETNWVSTASCFGWTVALKSDGTLWQWGPQSPPFNLPAMPQTRLGIHNDWTALTSVQDGIITLAADGSLWLWPNQSRFNYQQPLIKLPKQPQFLGNVLDAKD